jgi:hypothetical protein
VRKLTPGEQIDNLPGFFIKSQNQPFQEKAQGIDLKEKSGGAISIFAN